jgi:phage baseplate assembly protein V
MNEIVNAVKYHAYQAIQNMRLLGVGIVTSFDPNTFSCQVAFQPEDEQNKTLSNWMPIASTAIGNGFGICFSPNIGDQAIVGFLDGQQNLPVVLGFIYSNLARPESTPAGQFLIRHKSGSFISMDGVGNITIESPQTITLNGENVNITTSKDCTITTEDKCTINATGKCSVISSNEVLIDGDTVTINSASTANITANAINLSDGSSVPNALVLFNEMQAIFNNHYHTIPSPNFTDAPYSQMSPLQATQIIKGA